LLNPRRAHVRFAFRINTYRVADADLRSALCRRLGDGLGGGGEQRHFQIEQVV
jgi:hypothetical protein